MKEKRNNSTTLGDCNSPLSIIDRTTKRSNKLDKADIYRTPYPIIVEYTFFSSTNGIFSRIAYDRPWNNPKQILKVWNYTKYANQIKTIMTNHFTPPRITAIKKTDNDNCWQGCKEFETLLYFWWICKMVQLLWKSTVPHKVEKRNII